MFPTLDPPWRRKKCKVDLSVSVSTAGSKEQNPTLLCALAMSSYILQFYGRYLHVFTDASKLDSGQTAAAYCIPELDIEYSCCLPDDVTIFTGELAASKLSLLWIKQHYKRYRCNQK